MSRLQPHAPGAWSSSTSLKRSITYREQGGAFPVRHTNTLCSLRYRIPPPLEQGVTFLLTRAQGPVGRVPQVPPPAPQELHPRLQKTRLHTGLPRSRDTAPGTPRRSPCHPRPLQPVPLPPLTCAASAAARAASGRTIERGRPAGRAAARRAQRAALAPPDTTTGMCRGRGTRGGGDSPG